jgi:hypothetical protein
LSLDDYAFEAARTVNSEFLIAKKGFSEQAQGMSRSGGDFHNAVLRSLDRRGGIARKGNELD